MPTHIRSSDAYQSFNGPIDGTSAVGPEYCRSSEAPGTCTGVRETADRFIEAAIRVLEEPMEDNSRSAAILAREALMWIQQLEQWSLDDPPKFWSIPISESPASLYELTTVAGDLAAPQSEAKTWVLTYLVDAIGERASSGIPQRLLDVVGKEGTRTLDQLAADHPEVIGAGIARLIEEATPPEPEEPEPDPVDVEAERQRQEACGEIIREVRRAIEAGNERMERMGNFRPPESDEPKEVVPVHP